MGTRGWCVTLADPGRTSQWFGEKTGIAGKVSLRYNNYTMDFDFDPRKNASNRHKHGIDFTFAQALWGDPDLLEIPARTEDEPRFLVIGVIDGKHWSGVITHREQRIRIISVRRSRREEVALYES